MAVHKTSPVFYRNPGSFILLPFLYLTPVVLLYFGIIPYKERNVLLLCMTGVLATYTYLQKYSLNELGFTKGYLKPSLLINGLFSLIVIIALLVAKKMNLFPAAPLPEGRFFYLYYVFISGPCQEFLYRSVVFAAFKRLGLNAMIFIFISAINFSFLHIFYHDWIVIIVTLFFGLVMGAVYNKYPNFWGVAFSHVVLGAISMLVGLI